MRRKRRHYHAHSRSPAWKELRDSIKADLRRNKKAFVEKVKDRVKTSNNTKKYYEAIKLLKCRDAPKIWSPCDLFPNQPPEYVATAAADFFGGISSGFPSLDPPDPSMPLEPPSLAAVSNRLKKIKKTKTTLEGDINPQLVGEFADLLAPPVHHIISRMFRTAEWPTLWKTETVVVIPKTLA